MGVLEITSDSPEQTIAIGQCLAHALQPGDLLLLLGDFGSGKTHLVKGIALGLGSHDLVTSPSFVLVNEYRAGPERQGLPIYHVDLYRIGDPAEVGSIGLEELWDSRGICVIEWAEHAQGGLPADHLAIRMQYAGETARMLRLLPEGERAVRLVADVAARLPVEWMRYAPGD